MATDVQFADIVKWLKDNDWKFEVPEENRILMGCSGDNGRYQVLIRFRPEKELVSVLFYYPFSVPEEKRQAVSDAVTRMNYGLLFGNCEMDFSDGELRYRSYMPVDDSPLYPNQLRTIIMTSWATTDRYYPAFMDVIWGSTTPEEAIRKVESQEA